MPKKCPKRHWLTMKKKNDYAVVLCRKGGTEVKAIRANGFGSKEDVYLSCIEQCPEWNVKWIHRLYPEDFKEG